MDEELVSIGRILDNWLSAVVRRDLAREFNQSHDPQLLEPFWDFCQRHIPWFNLTPKQKEEIINDFFNH